MNKATASKVIVTGGCGYIGSHTVIELQQSGFDVIVVDDLSNSSAETIDRIVQITGKSPVFVNLDLKDEKACYSFFKEHQEASGVIHFAAHKAVGESVQKPLMYYQNNFFSLINCLSAMHELEMNNFIFSSSATVYGTPETLPITESEQTQRPFSPYGNTKKVAEEILEDFIDSTDKFAAISLRYFNPIGAHVSGLIGELPSGIPNNLMPYITQTAAGVREKLMIFGNDYPTKDGTPIRDYIHVVDLAKAHVVAIQRLLDKKQEKNYEIFNLGTGIGYSVMDVIQTFEEVSDQKLNYEITDRRPGDVTFLFASTDLAKEKLGWVAEKNLSEMISSSWEWERNFRNKNK